MIRATGKSLLFMLFLGGLAGPAAAQIDIEIPDMPAPPVKVPEILSGPVNVADRALRTLADARMLRIDKLARDNRTQLERVDAGELAIRAEVIAIDISEPALQRALAEKFQVKRARELADVGVKITVLQTPEGWSARRGLKQLRKLDPGGSYDYNHVYLDSGAAGAGEAAAPEGPRAQGRVGLIDGGLDQAHLVFQNVRLQHFGCDGQVVPTDHGTAVAAILAHYASVNEIFAADVYCGQPTGGASDAVAAAFSWMARERVAVINVSLVGPRNALLERVVNMLVSRGYLIVAAVGNDGPAAPPLYPASYAGVVGVTAVDGKHRVLVEACRGEQVDFAALGTDMKAASKAPDAFAPVRGTSFAAPTVAALMAGDFAAPDVAARDRLVASWMAKAVDLGKRGRDEVYGAGEIGTPLDTLAEKSQ